MNYREYSSIIDFKAISAILENGEWNKAQDFFSDLLTITEVTDFAADCLKAISFWQQAFARFSLFEGTEHVERGLFLIKQWIRFFDDFHYLVPLLQRELYGLRLFIFEQALNEFRQIPNFSHDEELLLNISRCYNGLDNLKEALKYAQEAFKRNKNNPTILAEWGDLLVRTDNDKMGRLLLKEAFFINPELIELAFIESPIVLKTIEKILEKEYDYKELKDWIPIYGTIYKVFCISRELRTVEYGKLRQAIFSMENSDEPMSSKKKARLLNHYFRLIDYLKNSRNKRFDQREEVEKLLSKVKLLDAEIYKEYIK